MDKDIIDDLYIIDDSLLLKKSIIRSPDPGLNYISTEDRSNNYYINWTNSIYDYYNPTFFVEGNDDNIEMEITILQSVVQEQVNYSFKKELTNGIHEFFEIPVGKYKLKSGNWFKIIDKYQEMIPGYINCQFSPNKCELDNNSLYVKCFRSNDNVFIGKYKIVNGNVVIPNLDCDTEYDLIFVDESKILEQKVQSRRKPAPYNIQ